MEYRRHGYLCTEQHLHRRIRLHDGSGMDSFEEIIETTEIATLGLEKQGNLVKSIHRNAQ